MPGSIPNAPTAGCRLGRAVGQDLLEVSGAVDTHLTWAHGALSSQHIITGTFINYVPPEFRVESMNDGRHRIHYISKREGLTPFVVGLLNGLATRFDSELEIHSQEALKVTSGEHTVFEVTVKC